MEKLNMRRIQTFLDAETAKALTELAEAKQVPLSTAVADIVKNHFNGDAGLNCGALDQEAKGYFLRIINTLNQVLMCVYDQDKAGLKEVSAQACIQEITQQIQGFLEMSKQ
jgi:hypothetical protein